MAFSFDTEGVVPQPSSALKASLRSSPWIPHSSLLVPGSAPQFLVHSAGRWTYKPHFKLVTAAVLSTDSVYRTGLATAAAARWQRFKRVQAQYNLLSERHSLLPPYCVHALDPLQASSAHNKVKTN